jgi:hypothetical protein
VTSDPLLALAAASISGQGALQVRARPRCSRVDGMRSVVVPLVLAASLSLSACSWTFVKKPPAPDCTTGPWWPIADVTLALTETGFGTWGAVQIDNPWAFGAVELGVITLAVLHIYSMKDGLVQTSRCRAYH